MSNKGEIYLSVRIKSLFIILMIVIVLAGCSAAAKEREDYFDTTQKNIEDNQEEIQSALDDFVGAVFDSEPEKSIKLLNEEMIPKYEELLEMMDDVELKENELLIELNDLSKQLIEDDMEKHLILKELFDDIMGKKETGETEDIDLDATLEEIRKSSKEQAETTDEFVEKLEEVDEEYDDVELREEEVPDDVNAEEIYEGYEQIIMQFIESVGGLSSKPKEAPDVDEDILADQGNPEVVFDGKVTLDGEFQLEGKSNLPEGSVLQMKTYEYGTENPYFKGDIPVEEDGSFSVEADIEDEALNGELLVVRVAYIPDATENKQSVGIYGEEGEKLEGNFIHPYTDIKRTRHGAFAYAYLELNDGEEAELEADVWGEAPEDYGDYDVWMEEAHVEVHDKYYDVTMNSNLMALTYIKAEVKAPGYQLSDIRSTTKVLPDGSFRFQIPRPDVEGNDISIEINALSDFAIDTEELYGADGENFEGDLVEPTKKGKKIQYILPIDEEDEE